MTDPNYSQAAHHSAELSAQAAGAAAEATRYLIELLKYFASKFQPEENPERKLVSNPGSQPDPERKLVSNPGSQPDPERKLVSDPGSQPDPERKPFT